MPLKKHIMLDLETMGTDTTSAIVSIGAVYFDETGVSDSLEFYTRITLASAMEAGLTVDASTILWWLKQSDSARKELTDSRAEPLSSALKGFADFVDPEAEVWGNGSDFDNAILSHAYSVLKMPKPWRYNNSRCFRTLRSGFVGAESLMPPNNSSLHNALADAKWQAQWASAIMKAQLQLAANHTN